MKIEGEGQLLRIYIGESDQWEGKPLYMAIVEKVRKEGLAGCTVFRGIEGFGASSRIHTAHILRLSEDLPILIEIADRKDRIKKILPDLQKMVGEGLITEEKIKILRYRHSA